MPVDPKTGQRLPYPGEPGGPAGPPQPGLPGRVPPPQTPPQTPANFQSPGPVSPPVPGGGLPRGSQVSRAPTVPTVGGAGATRPGPTGSPNQVARRGQNPNAGGGVNRPQGPDPRMINQNALRPVQVPGESDLRGALAQAAIPGVGQPGATGPAWQHAVTRPKKGQIT